MSTKRRLKRHRLPPELAALFCRRGRRVSEWTMRWQTRCRRAAIERVTITGYAPYFRAFFRDGIGWQSIERTALGHPRAYRTRLAAARVVARWLAAHPTE